MTKKYGVKDKDRVVEHVIGLLLEGRIRTGDRIDRNQIVADLGVSRVPVQEAVVQLEHDGILTTRYHRGAFVERFDPETVREHHEVYGLLSGVSSARAATHPTPRLLNQLKDYMEILRTPGETMVFQETVWAYRRAINLEYAGPRLQSAIRASQSFIPQAFWLNYEYNQVMTLPFYEMEHAALLRGDADAAREACAGRSAMMADNFVNELVRRGVFEASDAYPGAPDLTDAS